MKSIYVCPRCSEVHDANKIDAGNDYAARGDCPHCRTNKEGE